MKYEVLDNGKSVFSKKTTSDDFDREMIPEKFRGRPESGERVIKTDDEVISVLVPLDPSDPAASAPRVNVTQVVDN